MLESVKIYKKFSPNGKIILYMGTRNFCDSISGCITGFIDGVVVLDDEYLINQPKVFAQLLFIFRYGREYEDRLGLCFQKEFIITTEQIKLLGRHSRNLTQFQQRLIRKLGSNAFPFKLLMPNSTPMSVILNPGIDNKSQPHGVHYFVRIFAGDCDTAKSCKSSTVSMRVNKIQCSPYQPIVYPYTTIIRKHFLFSRRRMIIFASLNKNIYHYSENIDLKLAIRNDSSKTVTKISAWVQQCVQVILFEKYIIRHTIAAVVITEGFPIRPGNMHRTVICFQPLLSSIRNQVGIALNGYTKPEEAILASSTLPLSDNIFGILIKYNVKIKVTIGGIGKDIYAELPFILTSAKTDSYIKVVSDDF